MADRTPEAISDAVAHVGYELTSMVEFRNRLVRSENVGDQEGTNAYLEAMLVHARSLIEFLVQKPKRPDNMHRHDFAPGIDIDDNNLTAGAEGMFHTISQHLSHLTWHRVGQHNDAPEWVRELPDDVVGLFAAWLAAVRRDDEMMALRFDPHLNEARRLLRQSLPEGPASYTTSSTFMTTDRPRGPYPPVT